MQGNLKSGMEKREGDFCSIAVDMGAGSIRVMLATLRDNAFSLEEIHRFDNEIRVQDGRDTWDMDYISREIVSGISKAIEVSELVPESVGVDTWGVDFVLLDRNGDLVETPVAYRDKRTEGMQEKWKKIMPKQETFSRTGINFYIFNTLFQLLSAKDSKALQRTSKILFVPCYINYLLSGRMVNELTIASTSQMLAVEGGEWDEMILEKLDLDVEKLGKVVQPGTILGPLLLPETGEKRIECVAVCGHDTACVVAALPVENPNFTYISAGTWCIVGVESTRPLISEEALKLGFTNERGYGNSYRSLKNIVGLWLLQGLKKQLAADISFSQMEEMVQGSGETSQVIDPDDPGFYNPENMKEAFDRYFEKTRQPLPVRFKDYIRCAYDSLCFSFRYHIEQLEKLSQNSIEVLHLVGGGSQSDYLCQRIASICEREVISGPVEGAAMGNIIIQGIAMGRIKDLQAGRKLVKSFCQVKEYIPGGDISGILDRYSLYLKLKT
ncbi:MAG: rhamnulokinase [Bacteroidetes bacterium]|nr:MAG: rhamnulokinase [Bacteroidota bacterium]